MDKTKKVLAFGTFDIFHKGHEFYLKNARKHGDILNVVVARDSTVKQIKGKYPLNNELKRLAVIQNLNYVDKAFLGYEEDKYKIIEEIRPDIICLGYDQKSFNNDLKNKLKKRGLNPKIIKFEKGFKPEVYKTSKL
ncbi:FAD synthase [Candidatus Woesearchaeota archaeon CG06_land_8_20_14_3_00_33_13]|nr:MAG: FAD synthase [Candidatus Woesearchaeota archaeon CG10_big_fil_rev_8_21_14_0_10_33_12]PIU72274.1 MAG: FAD synthase [Candidatus Woesearchaeota archaeon CG06_land_8_20_14_3_00_33_13]